MKILVLVLLMIPQFSFAHCPIPVDSQGEIYCLDVAWYTGEKKVKGQFVETGEVTPVLNAMGLVPSKWIYSRAIISAWKKGDAHHQFVEIPGFRIFPNMEMQSGHHHSTGYEFSFVTDEAVYQLQRMAFQQMAGCWSLRWTTETSDELVTSQHLMDLVEFANLSEAENSQQAQFCAN